MAEEQLTLRKIQKRRVVRIMLKGRKNRPQYEEHYHITSWEPCPFCGGHEWVEFYYDHVRWNVSATPVDGYWTIDAAIDKHDFSFPGEDIAECIKCGAVLS